MLQPTNMWFIAWTLSGALPAVAVKGWTVPVIRSLLSRAASLSVRRLSMSVCDVVVMIVQLCLRCVSWSCVLQRCLKYCAKKRWDSSAERDAHEALSIALSRCARLKALTDHYMQQDTDRYVCHSPWVGFWFSEILSSSYDCCTVLSRSEWCMPPPPCQMC